MKIIARNNHWLYDSIHLEIEDDKRYWYRHGELMSGVLSEDLENCYIFANLDSSYLILKNIQLNEFYKFIRNINIPPNYKIAIIKYDNYHRFKHLCYIHVCTYGELFVNPELQEQYVNYDLKVSSFENGILLDFKKLI